MRGRRVKLNERTLGRFPLFRVMKSCLKLAPLLLLAAGARPGVSSDSPRSKTPSECTLRLHVDGLRNERGAVGVLLFRSADGWPEDIAKAARSEASSIAPGQRQVTVSIDGVEAGDYGVVALHDENRNMKLDRNIFGFPKEGFGFANNPHVGLGPPAFRAASLHVVCPATETTIHIQYK